MTDEERKQFINEYCGNVGNIKIKCDDCKFVEDCVDYGWEGVQEIYTKGKRTANQRRIHQIAEYGTVGRFNEQNVRL